MQDIDQIIDEEILNYESVVSKINSLYESFSGVTHIPTSILLSIHKTITSMQNADFQSAVNNLETISDLISDLNQVIQQSIITLKQEI